MIQKTSLCLVLAVFFAFCHFALASVSGGEETPKSNEGGETTIRDDDDEQIDDPEKLAANEKHLAMLEEKFSPLNKMPGLIKLISELKKTKEINPLAVEMFENKEEFEKLEKRLGERINENKGKLGPKNRASQLESLEKALERLRNATFVAALEARDACSSHSTHFLGNYEPANKFCEKVNEFVDSALTEIGVKFSPPTKNGTLNEDAEEVEGEGNGEEQKKKAGESSVSEKARENEEKKKLERIFAYEPPGMFGKIARAFHISSFGGFFKHLTGNNASSVAFEEKKN